MPTIDVKNIQGETVGSLELNADVFDIEVNEHAVYEAVKNHLANRRQGTQSSKTRAEVRGGGRKPWRQKGTGRARHGSRRSPIWKGGGVIFAPKPRDYSYKLPKKIKRLAMRSVLTSKVRDNELIVVDQIAFDACSTKEALKVLNALGAQKKALVLLDAPNDTVLKSFRNIPFVHTAQAANTHVYEMLRYDSLIATQGAIEKLQEALA